MAPDYITMAIPVFLFLIAVEIIVSRLKKGGYYDYHDSVNDLSAGILSQVVGVFGKIITVGLYVYVYQNWRLLEISEKSVIAWVACFFGVDFFYYWFHRIAHESAVFWGSHLPHHQSEEYNLTVALRQGAFQSFFSMWFYVPLALVGIPPLIFLVHSQFNTIYQFWIHTRAVGKLGFLEIFMNTPSHHRVHHGKNPIYIDKNYAGTLIIWDKMFGTFQEETEEVHYGTIKPLASWNPIWAQVHYFLELFQKSIKAPRFLDKILLWFKGPGWLPSGLEYDAFMADPAYSPEGMKNHVPARYPAKYRTRLSTALEIYTFVNFLFTLGFASYFFFMSPTMLVGAKLFYGGFVALSLLTLGGIFESKRWAHILEIHRLFIGALMIALYGGDIGFLGAIPVMMAVFFYLQVFRTEMKKA